jgi:hypothetical protein
MLGAPACRSNDTTSSGDPPSFELNKRQSAFRDIGKRGASDLGSER